MNENHSINNSRMKKPLPKYQKVTKINGNLENNADSLFNDGTRYYI